MDDATRLISELQAKLTELDSKVAAYRQDMAAEFTRYSDQLLRNIPEEVLQKVSQAVADSMPNYPSLNLPHKSSTTSSLDEPRSPTPTDLPGLWRGRISPPPILPHTSGTPKEAVRSPHDREKEFHGLFTPRYLPLLDGSERPLHSPPTSPPTSPPPVPEKVEEKVQLEIAQTLEVKPTPAEENPRPAPIRCPTDATTSSIDSVGSDTSTKIRKSALRRSSSASKPPDSPRDPRRVRFEFQGAEVLPTSSPQSSEPVPPEIGSEEDESAFPEESFPESSIGDIEGEEDPPPKKVSSSQALRALSRSPLDAGTVWTVVNPDPDPDPENSANSEGQDNTRSSSELSSPEQTSTMPPKATAVQPKVQPSRDAQASQELGSRLGALDINKDKEKDDDVSDDDSLFMSSKKKQKKGSISPGPQSPIPTAATSTPLAISKSNKPNSTTPTATPPYPSVRARDDEADDLFDLEVADDDEGLKKATSAQTSPTKHLPEPVEDEPEEPAPKHKGFPVPLYSSSPAMGIPQRPVDVNKQPPRATPVPSSSYVAGSVGSFKGRPLYMGSVKDPKILEEVLAMGDVPNFVGSVNGRSGVDASNPKSYRATLQSPGQTPTPTSFTERYIKERDEKGGYDTEEEKQARNDYF
ncbi:hypothetical protein UCRPA7_14 [Phaeoacremonium minimum UCRPA7]|uniref:Uncharacterized protein n=1 Tax=Phaeoacremonium minimum (strain UCR-PA7) TaxID=1286976 RepID=R8BYE5_PHAM7|nr:hypothetical protein UCRPA7_14 [Phaeoacremonium minimum UCRPA7]EOO04411.1 hypothetical protein UCRPA7_14 [Phaeoacremonium minimum UCRPA7]